ncbi:metabolite traffic protein EboE [Stieleria sp. TO1_6]|uniref:metabolite traffic protein EboE n=1 Tax=Stieleria tagensis TaxID=2956795 RepID=UPI00209BACC2|nr:metabolite traffic protein EboE [Stieleria tagensis]MCO8122262.1 metabolite traffic protein EboE [Stieleria tagensis]
MNQQIGYCTNVHAGIEMASIRRNLTEYAMAVRQQLQQSNGIDQLGVGLWIPDKASTELIEGQLGDFRRFLSDGRLRPYTINGFPFANFHGDSVKQRVYLPTWADAERLEYTQRLATILAALLPDDQPLGSISTLPIGWPNNPFAADSDAKQDLATAGDQLRQLAEFLKQLEHNTGKRIVVAIEPEPGCLLDTVDDMVEFFDDQLPELTHRRFITVCHDICHSAVMNESQRAVIQRYGDADITVGKVQVSSAIVADWNAIPATQHAAALKQLSEFAEDRYLHQTGQVGTDGSFRLATDLPQLIQQTSPADLAGVERWVIHFHVPIFLERFGLLTTTRDAVLECLQALDGGVTGVDFTGHLEVETYAWTVLPAEMRRRGLADDIASELQWLINQLD